MRLIALSLAVAIFLRGTLTAASSGDRSLSFQFCLRQCLFSSCSADPPSTAIEDNTIWRYPGNRTMMLALTRWSCVDDCKYSCSHSVTDNASRAIASSSSPIDSDDNIQVARVEQFYGKWAFKRLFGMQEPASVIFSLLNLREHVIGLSRLRALSRRRKGLRDVPAMSRPDDRRASLAPSILSLYIAWAILNMNAWVCSSIFHTRDKPLTEKLDYFSAGSAILFSLMIAVIRLFHLYTPDKALPRRAVYLTGIVAYIGHVSYLLSSERFDYSYNILANVLVGVTHNILWLAFSTPAWPLPRYLRSRKGAAKDAKWVVLPGALAIGTSLATALELFDFPPLWRVLDAHSLWHAATIPIARLWYRFLLQDAKEVESRGAGVASLP